MKTTLKNILLAILMIAGNFAPVLVQAWNVGSEQKTYTIAEINSNQLGNKAVLNSIKDDQVEAHVKDWNNKNPDNKILSWTVDETQFMGVKEADNNPATDEHGWISAEAGQTIEAKPGQTYLVKMLVHNNNPKGTAVTANDVKAYVNLGQNEGAKAQTITSHIAGSNTNEVYDVVNFVSNENFNLDYVDDSIYYLNNWTLKNANKNGIDQNGFAPLSDNIFSSRGTQIGYNKYDSNTKQFTDNIPGCYEYSGWIYFSVVPQFQQERIGVTKSVAVHNDIADALDKLEQTNWNDHSIKANVGDTVDYLIDYRNANLNGLPQKGVVFNDVLPQGFEYVLGSTKFIDYNADGTIYAKGDPVNIDGRDEAIYNITTIGFNASAPDKGFKPTNNDHSYVVMFSARITDAVNKPACDQTMSYTNYARVSATIDNVRYYNDDTANVLVDGPVCPETPVNPDPVTPVTPAQPDTTPSVIASTGAGLGAIVGTGAIAYGITALKDKKHLFKNLFRK